MTTFSDDEQIFGCHNEAAARSIGSSTIEESESAVLPELTGRAQPNERCGLDLVIVLDFTDTMNRQDRSEILKKATGYMIKTLSPIHRVSIVSLSNVANRLCALRQTNKKSKKYILNLVNGITPGGGANICDGLEMALQVLNRRKFTEGRSVGIILMSNSEQNKDGNIASQVEVASVPIYTFSFGTSMKKSMTIPHVLEAIAHCFTGFLTLALDGLERIISPETVIQNENAGDYEESRDDCAVSVCITFGEFDDIETRQVVVDHILPPVTSMVRAQVLKAADIYSNKLGKTELESAQTALLFASVKRIRNVTEVEIVDPMFKKDLRPLGRTSKKTLRIARFLPDEGDNVGASVGSEVTSKPRASSKLYYERPGFTTRDDIKK